MPGPSLLHQFLGARRVPHAEEESRPTAAMRYGTTAPVSTRNRAKVIVCLVDGDPIEALLPVSLAVNLTRLLALAGGNDIRSASVDEVTLLSRTGDAEIMRASESARAQPVFVDVALVSEAEIVITSDDGAEATYLRWDEFARSVRPIVGKFAEPPLLWARCRLSPSE